MGQIKSAKPTGKKVPQKRQIEENHDDDDDDKRHEDDDYEDEDDQEEEEELTDTVFIRNLARFDTTQETLKDHIEKNFGETVYCLICKDKETGESKGTGFVKFKSIDTARECLEQYEDPEHQTKFFLDGRNLFFLPALSRDKINEVKRASAPKDEAAAPSGPKKNKKPRWYRAKPINSQQNNSPSKSDSTEKMHSHPGNDVKKGKPLKKNQHKKGDRSQGKPQIGQKSFGVFKKNKQDKKKFLSKKAAGKTRGRH